MDRLTEPNYTYDDCDFMESGMAPYMNRLAEYEDTGLTPEICAEYKKFEDEAVGKNVTFARIVELMSAESEGRLIVQPCKVGDMVYYRRGRDILGDTVERIIIDGIDNQVLVGAHKVFMFLDFGRNVFLTREEAEAALKEDHNGE